MNTYPIYARLTHNYAAGWAHLDQWEHLFNLKLTPPRLLRAADNGDIDQVMHGRLNTKQREQTKAVWEKLPSRDRPPFKHWLRDVIAGAFDRGCQCEHDCCGHYQSYAVGDIYGRRVVVTVHSYRNL